MSIDLRSDAGVATMVGMGFGDGVRVSGAGSMEGQLNAIAADLNNDGLSDLIIGFPFNGGPDGSRTNAGAVFVLFSRPNQPGSGVRDLAGVKPDVILYGADAGDLFGFSLAAGDVNGDGRPDLIIGAPQADGPDNSRTNVGEVYVFFGGSSLAGAPVRDLRSSSADVTIYGWGGLPNAKSPDQAGSAVAAGDVNGDGLADIVVGAPGVSGPDGKRDQAGAVYVFFGTPGLLSGTVKDVGSSPASGPQAVDILVYGQATPISFFGLLTTRVGEALGTAVAVGDMNGDRIGDIVIGAPNFSTTSEVSRGQVYVVFGKTNPDKIRDTRSQNRVGPQPDVIIQGKTVFSFLGNPLTVGDVNGDRFDDIIIGSTIGNGPTQDRFGAGEVYVIFGSDKLRGTRDLGKKGQEQDITIFGADAGDSLGFRVAAGDFNGDGIADILVSAPAADGPNNERDGAGEVYVIIGGRSLTTGLVLDFAQQLPPIVIYGSNKGDQIGFALALGNFNGDGKPDLVVTSPFGDGPPDVRRPKAGVTYIIAGR
ncbi:MAG TPA: hypothetical protein VNM72_06570 [Blastocatellia bacterium]|nr:hypothetical protein [Blastocatellia bacterium]